MYVCMWTFYTYTVTLTYVRLKITEGLHVCVFWKLTLRTHIPAHTRTHTHVHMHMKNRSVCVFSPRKTHMDLHMYGENIYMCAC